MRFKKDPERILIVSLSNIGDVFLTAPVVSAIRVHYPDAKLSLLVGKGAKDVFWGDPRLQEIIPYDKRAPFLERWRFLQRLRKRNFDLVVDLRQTLFPFLLGSPMHTPLFAQAPRHLLHKMDRHLWKLRFLDIPAEHRKNDALWIQPESEKRIEERLGAFGLRIQDPFILLSPGAKSDLKRWKASSFAALSDLLHKEKNFPIIFIGETNDQPFVDAITASMHEAFHSLVGQTSLPELVALIRASRLLVTNDSASLHIASLLGTPTVAIFGPTDSRKYGPRAERSRVVRKALFCAPCEKARCPYHHECMEQLPSEEVYQACCEILGDTSENVPLSHEGTLLFSEVSPLSPVGFQKRPSRILIVRPDRIGDVLLSTPAIEALRKALPDAWMMALVAPHAREIVDRNPYLNGIFLLEKEKRHKGFWGMVRLVRELRRYQFDTAVVLHGTRRVHLALALARIPDRIGYDRKWGIFLTKRLKDVKVFGERHETEYSLDLLRASGVTVEGGNVTIPTTTESDIRIGRFLKERGVSEKDHLVTIHPGAKSLSKRWMAERFAEVADRLKMRNYKIIIVTGPMDVATGRAVIQAMRYPPIDACGQTTVRELASLFKRSELLISNDSGPVHVAVGVGTPVISIFGRNQPGLSQGRWKPLGRQDIVLQKDVGCAVCLADDCQINFECLKALRVEEVLEAAHQILSKKE